MTPSNASSAIRWMVLALSVTGCSTPAEHADAAQGDVVIGRDGDRADSVGSQPDGVSTDASNVDATTSDARIDDTGPRDDGDAHATSDTGATSDASDASDGGPTNDAGNPCVDVAPTGVTRQTGVTVRTYSPALVRTGVPVYGPNGWDAVLGYNYNTANGMPLIPWPGVSNLVTNLQMLPNRYLALEFTVPATGAPGAYGFLGTTQTGTTVIPVVRTISQCPGDFRTSIPAACRADQGEGSGILWSLHDEVGACRLVPGQTYYLNIVTASLADPSTTDCPTGMTSCGFSVTNTVYVAP